MARGLFGESRSESASRSTRAGWWLTMWGLPFVMGIVGILLAEWLRVPLREPGHKGLYVMAALLLGRLGSRNPFGAMVGSVGGLVAGGVTAGYEPMWSLGLILAGPAIDALLFVTSRLLGRVSWLLPVVGMVAGALGNGAELLVRLLVGHVPQAMLGQGTSMVCSATWASGLLGG